MSGPPISPLLDQMLRTVVRRYRLPTMAGMSSELYENSPSNALAATIEGARLALDQGKMPDQTIKHRFLVALVRLIRDAMQATSGDPAFQAMVLRHHVPQVREFASLSAHADQDRRQVRAAVNAIAHPGKLRRMHAQTCRQALAGLHALASSASWAQLANGVRQLQARPDGWPDASVGCGLQRILEAPALGRLQRLDVLASDAVVRDYQRLWERHGPRSGSATAARQGTVSRRRGATVEALAAQALEAVARKLNATEGAGLPYRVVTSLRVPSSLIAGVERAKGEWDAVLLRQADDEGGSSAWDVCLLVEAKASVDAVATDLPRLVRGLRLLAQAEPTAVYPFETRQGAILLRGASLSTLPHDESDLSRTVLYCTDAPADEAPRLLSAASRMQLLSHQASLDFGGMLAGHLPASHDDLEPVWHDLLQAPRWHAVLAQYPTLQQARALMVHTDDLRSVPMR